MLQSSRGSQSQFFSLKPPNLDMHDTRHISVAIIGTGFSGLGMAIRLKQTGIEDFLIFERANEVGGTWRDNSYPGCACDIESHLYSFSFALNPKWTQKFSTQPEIWEYLKKCVKDFGILPHIRFGHDVKSAAWNNELQLWSIQTSTGIFTATVLIVGTGLLSEPKIPDIKGLSSFQGEVFHSSQWNHEYDLRCKNVAVVGTGASAIQFVPAIQPQVTKLHLFQRTAPWVIPRFDRTVTQEEQRLLKFLPILQKFLRLRIYVLREILGIAFRYPKKLMPYYQKRAMRHLKRWISDVNLRSKLIPEYTIGCKRILISNNYYPSLTQQNVEVITDGIQEIQSHSILLNDGSKREIDAIIFATGFHLTEMSFLNKFQGNEGQILASPKAYLGTAVAGFPNLFLLFGPNTALGHTSILLMLEVQFNYIIKILTFMRKHKIAALEPKAHAQNAFVAAIERWSKSSVWISGGCKSWYLDPTGLNSTLWPCSVGAFKRLARKFKVEDYIVSSKT